MKYSQPILSKNTWFFLFFLSILLIYFGIHYISQCCLTLQEGFWNPSLLSSFQIYSQTQHPTIIYDTDQLQKQASPHEVQTLLQTNLWPWDSSTQSAFLQDIQQDTILSINPDDAMNQFQNIFNNQAMKEQLYWKTPQGQFLLHGKWIPDTQSPDSNTSNGFGLFAKNSGIDPHFGKKWVGCSPYPQQGLIQLQNNTYPSMSPITPPEAGISIHSPPCNICSPLSLSSPSFNCTFTIIPPYST
jgi:hypothetical protein